MFKLLGTLSEASSFDNPYWYKSFVTAQSVRDKSSTVVSTAFVTFYFSCHIINLNEEL